MKTLILLFCALGMALSSWAYDFSSNGIYYNITSSTNKTVAVTRYSSSSYYTATSITIPSTVANAATGTTYSVTAIADSAFFNSTTLTTITIPSSVTTIGKDAFEGSAIISITIPSGVTSIEEKSFANCMSLKTVSLPSTVTSIGIGAFLSCSLLVSINLPSGLTYIGSDAFSLCAKLPSPTIPSTVTYIGSYAFANCTSITSVNIPASVTSIGAVAFVNCTQLATLTVEDANAKYTAVDNVLFSKDITDLVCYPRGKTATSYSIPSTVTSIENEAFWYCTSLTDIYACPTSPVKLAYSAKVFTGIDTTTCTLHVPSGSLDAYQKADVWKGFKTISADIITDVSTPQASTSGISVHNGRVEITDTQAGMQLAVYTLQGAAIYSGKTSGADSQSIPLPGHGVYIVQMGGKCVKVVY